jgi:hypothetical protein|tara:strand:- start:576 stop:686 length:111 start_codon:yes stop_codon:yes gene_type:complete
VAVVEDQLIQHMLVAVVVLVVIVKYQDNQFLPHHIQ